MYGFLFYAGFGFIAYEHEHTRLYLIDAGNLCVSSGRAKTIGLRIYIALELGAIGVLLSL